MAQDTRVRRIVDGYLDVVGNQVSLFKRPALEQWTQPSSLGIDGLFDWDELGLLVVVTNGTVYAYDANDVQITLGTIPQLGTRVSFAQAKISGSQILCLCANGQIYRTDGTASSLTVINAADAPTKATHIAFLDNYLIANNDILGDRGRFFWSDLNDPTAWTATSYQGADGKPDDIAALAVGYRELIVVGRKTVEMFYNDGSTPFGRLEGTEVQTGCSAPYSLAFAGGSWIFMNDKRKFVMIQNRSPVAISADIDEELQSLTTVSDAVADSMYIGGKEFYIVSFPEDKRTFVYDLLIGTWYEWAAWNTSTSTYDNFRGNCYAYVQRRNTHFVGDRANGRVYKLKTDVYRDNSTLPVRTLLETGYISHDTHNYKRSNALQMRLECNSGSTQGEVILKYRDQDDDDFGNEISLSDQFTTTNNNFFCSVEQLGMYRARQWQIIHSDNTPFILSDVQEDVEIMAR